MPTKRVFYGGVMESKKEYLFNVKVLYRKGGHKYANLFDKNMYDMGIELGTITGYRKMNKIERFLFRNCL